MRLDTIRGWFLPDACNAARADTDTDRQGVNDPHDPKVGRPKGAGNGVVHALFSGAVLFGALTARTAECAVRPTSPDSIGGLRTQSSARRRTRSIVSRPKECLQRLPERGQPT
jgi:hypothetical protein